MTIVPSDGYFDGDSGGERADKVVSGFVVAVMLFILATGFALVAYLAFQQMRSSVVVAAASPAAATAENAPAIVDDALSSNTADAGSTAALSPADDEVIGDDTGAGEVVSDAPTEPEPLPAVKPAKTKPPTVIFDSSIIDDIDPPPSLAIPDEAAAVQGNDPVEPAVEDQLPRDVATAEVTAPATTPAAEPAAAPDIAAALESALPEAAPSEVETVSEPPVQAEVASAEPAPSSQPDVAEPDDAPALPADPQAAAPEQIDALAGTHVVQVGSFRSEEEALADWGRIERRFPVLLAGKSRHVEPADLGERGVFYRLRIGPFGSVEEARTHCQALKEGRQDCLVVRH